MIIRDPSKPLCRPCKKCGRYLATRQEHQYGLCIRCLKNPVYIKEQDGVT